MELSVRRWRDGRWEEARDQVADEVPVALTFNSIPHVVMLATPADLLDLGRGFAYTEGLVAAPEELRARSSSSAKTASKWRCRCRSSGWWNCWIVAAISPVAPAVGVCGAETIEDAIRIPAPVAAGGRISREALAAALSALRSQQALNAGTGSLHAAAWVGWDGQIRLVREDIGRHNALDKVIGALLEQRADRGDGLLLITSRASYEMAQKAATAGVRMLVAVSAPTALAVSLAQRTGLTLVGFARESQQVVYTHPERLT